MGEHVQHEFVGPGGPTDRRNTATLADPGARALLHRLLRRVRRGEIVIRERGRERRFGRAGPTDPRASVTVHHPAAYRAVATEGSIGLGRGYFNGWWHTDDLPAVIRVLSRNTDGFDRWNARADRWFRPATDPLRRLRRPDRARDREHIHAHYDLGNDFFELFLDETMMYSCAVFDRPDVTLAEASEAKLDRLSRKLRLRPTDHVVEIGTGWGGFAVHAARRHGCRVTTTTISDEQHEYATKRVVEAGLEDRVSVLNRDYRDLDGAYDKLVSIEMIEAVDWREYDTFFGRCSALLQPGGLMALQAITIDDRRFELRKHREDFMKRFIFPGGCIPSVAAINESLARATDLRLVDLEDIGPHYAETLRRWRAGLRRERDALAGLGLDGRFERMWDFYLASCEAGFEEQRVSDVQLVMAKPDWVEPGLGPRPA